MRLLPAVRSAFVAAISALAGAGPAAADDTPTVVELFTSQSCYSCPPAEAYLGELATRDGVVALEFHVDYWDSLTYGSHGRWKDVFSDPAFTARQRAYNLALRGSGNVYTPQMVVAGRHEAVGSDRSEVGGLIARAGDTPGPATLTLRRDGTGLGITVDGARGQAVQIWLVTFMREHVTEVKRGENHGKTLISRNIVRAMHPVGEWRGGSATFDVADLALEPGQGCAVLVQREAGAPVLAGRYCPEGAGS